MTHTKPTHSGPAELRAETWLAFAVLVALVVVAIVDPALAVYGSLVALAGAAILFTWHRWRRVCFVLVIGVVTGAFAEAALVAVRRLPVLAGAAPALRELARELYMLDRHMIQFEPDAATYDSNLGYTLRPGSFRFNNTEFDTGYEVNHFGVRDDERSLVAPEIVVVGDSFAMGWGVDQDEAFPQVLERLTGRRVVNTAISSYGTARELLSLQRFDRSAATHLVIQFCNNDFFENRRFARQGDRVVPQSAASYAAAVAAYQRGRRYLPGRYLATLLGHRLDRLRQLLPLARSAPSNPDPDDPLARQQQIDLFLKAMNASPVDLSALEIVVFELNSYNRGRDWFAPMLRTALAERSLPDHLHNMRVLDLAAELGPEHWYTLDDHLRPSGHRLIAERLAEVVEGL